jgi:cytochrome c553
VSVDLCAQFSHEEIPMRAIQVPLLTLLLLAAAHVAASAEAPESPPLATKPDIAHGEQLFAVCAACHGPSAGGKQDGSVPAIAGQHPQVLTKLLLDFRYFRRWDSRMAKASASDHLRGPQEIADVVAYVSSLPPERAPGIGAGEHLADGARVYALQCAKCHGTQARGDGAAGYPRLAGQQYGYLMRQIRDGRGGVRPTFSKDHVRLLRNLAARDIEGVADHLSRLADTP